MATATINTTRRRSGIRTAAWVVAVLVVLAACAALIVSIMFVRAAQAALPQVDGMVHIAGLSAPASVVRDIRGVPHIRAANATDLFTAQGYVTAQDRLWQMDMSRRYSAGELAEVLGGGYVALDQQQRILRLRLAAEKAVALLSPRDR